MAEPRSQPQHVQVHTTTKSGYNTGVTPPQPQKWGDVSTQYRQHHDSDAGSIMNIFPDINLTGAQFLVILAGVPLGGTLLLAAGLSLIGSLIGLALATPVFFLFSPVLVPAIAVIALAVGGVLAAGACGLAGLVSFSWVVNYMRKMHGTVPEQLNAAKRRVADMAEYAGEKTKEVGQGIQNRAQETKRTSVY